VISLADGCSEELLARAKWFLSEQPKPSATNNRELARLERNVASCIRLRAKEFASLRAYLNEFE
ncbi:hypothetical protein MJD09_05290, partial [bacterium]|nr:hypothetical protein [bacterium]